MVHPEERDKIILAGIHPSTFSKLLLDERWSALGDYTALLSDRALLEIPSAIYQGLNRPRFGTEIDETVYTYHMECNVSYSYADVDPSREPPVKGPAPLHCLFTAFVSLEETMLRDIKASLPPGDAPIIGGVLYWEWTPASPFVAKLPVDHDSRYRRKVWIRP